MALVGGAVAGGKLSGPALCAPLAVVCPVAEGGHGPALRALPSSLGGDGDFSTHPLFREWHEPPGLKDHFPSFGAY